MPVASSLRIKLCSIFVSYYAEDTLLITRQT